MIALNGEKGRGGDVATPQGGAARIYGQRSTTMLYMAMAAICDKSVIISGVAVPPTPNDAARDCPIPRCLLAAPGVP